MHTILLIAIGGFFGATARFYISNFIKNRTTASFPIATFLVNMSGSFLFGYLVGVSNDWQLVLTVGFMGAYTTFSTFNLESIKLIEEKKFTTLIIYYVGSYALGISLAYLGITLSPEVTRIHFI